MSSTAFYFLFLPSEWILFLLLIMIWLFLFFQTIIFVHSFRCICLFAKWVPAGSVAAHASLWDFKIFCEFTLSLHITGSASLFRKPLLVVKLSIWFLFSPTLKDHRSVRGSSNQAPLFYHLVIHCTPLNPFTSAVVISSKFIFNEHFISFYLSQCVR